MAFLSSFDICASGLSAQRLRMDIASENVSNIDTTRTEAGGAYRRKTHSFLCRKLPFGCGICFCSDKNAYETAISKPEDLISYFSSPDCVLDKLGVLRKIP